MHQIQQGQPALTCVINKKIVLATIKTVVHPAPQARTQAYLGLLALQECHQAIFFIPGQFGVFKIGTQIVPGFFEHHSVSRTSYLGLAVADVAAKWQLFYSIKQGLIIGVNPRLIHADHQLEILLGSQKYFSQGMQIVYAFLCDDLVELTADYDTVILAAIDPALLCYLSPHTALFHGVVDAVMVQDAQTADFSAFKAHAIMESIIKQSILDSGIKSPGQFDLTL